MQQCYEKDLKTLYREDPMAPGAAHPPMYDENTEYPWQQYEPTTRSIFMAVELTPQPAKPQPENRLKTSLS